jgi:hypothetical protein
MDQLLALLGVPPGGALFITDLRVEGWGRDVVLRVVYRAAGIETRCRVTLADCRELTWRVYVAGDTTGETPLVDVFLGRSGHRSPAKLLAGAFGLTAVYGELVVTPEDGGVYA